MGSRGVLWVRLWQVKILWVWIMGVTLVTFGFLSSSETGFFFFEILLNYHTFEFTLKANMSHLDVRRLLVTFIILLKW
jgi:hypothetical protein